jgi:hypothetical protein
MRRLWAHAQALGTCAGSVHMRGLGAERAIGKNSALVGISIHENEFGCQRLRIGRNFESADGSRGQAKRRADASCSATRRRARIKGSIRTVPSTTYRTAAAGESVGTLAISNSAIWRIWSA